MAYTTINKSSSFMNPKLFVGNSSTNAITGVGFQPDLVWTKNRQDTYNHSLFDSVRGTTKRIASNETIAEATVSASLTAFDSDGFTLGNDTTSNASNNYASWNWKAGTSFNNNAGANGASLASTGSVNTTSGFSIVSYTGYSPNASTVYHGLGTVPKMIIFKRLVGAANWAIYNETLGNTKAVFLNSQSAPDTSSGYFNDTTPTNQVFSVANSGDTNSNGNPMIAYCFSEVPGFSKIGSYRGNNSTNGTFVYTGFKPSFLMVYNYTAGNENWMLVDNKRDGFNVENEQLFPNTNIAEESNDEVDLLSNGFKLRRNNSRMNGVTPYIYMAFGQSLVGTNNIPNNAR